MKRVLIKERKDRRKGKRYGERERGLTLPADFSATSEVSFRMTETKYILIKVIALVKHCWNLIV